MLLECYDRKTGEIDAKDYNRKYSKSYEIKYFLLILNISKIWNVTYWHYKFRTLLFISKSFSRLLQILTPR